jgi:hypothetical protein
LVRFVKDIGRNRDPWASWLAHVGEPEPFEKRWAAWWQAQSGDPTRDLRARAVAATFASFLGRTAAERQTFATLDEFTRAAEARQVKTPSSDWLPPGVLAQAVATMRELGNQTPFELGKSAAGAIQVTATLADGTRVSATYNAAARPGPGRVTIATDDLPAVIARAKALAAEKKVGAARALVQDAIKRSPRSPSVEAAREALRQMN